MLSENTQNLNEPKSRKVIALIPALVLAFVLSFSSFTLLPLAFLMNEEAEPGTTEEERVFEDGGFYYIDENGNRVEQVAFNAFTGNSSKSKRSLSKGSLPSRYSLFDEGLTTPIKKQLYSDCWAYAACSALECSAARQGAESPDFSESHLCYFTMNPKTEGFKTVSAFNTGGNQYYTIYSLASLQGPANESDFPMQSSISDMVYDESDRYNSGSGYTVSDCVELSSADDIKNWILEKGEVFVNIYLTNSSLGASTKYNTYTLYNTYKSSNHAVTIIGWDDDFDVSEFTGSYKPTQNGAWIIKNSAGNQLTPFYMSYEQYLNGVTGISVRESEGCLNDYTYAPGGYNKYLNNIEDYYIEGANIFESSCSDSEDISTISFYVDKTNQPQNGSLDYDVTVRIYKNLTDGSNPLSGSLAYEKQLHYDYYGYYVLDLEEVVNVVNGEKYSVCIGFNSNNSSVKPSLPIEGVDASYSSYSMTYYSENNQSFYRLSQDDPFIDLKSSTRNNFFMHAYTKEHIHSFSWIYNDDATVRADGTESEKCSLCGALKGTRTAEGTKIYAPNVDAVIYAPKAATFDYGTKITIEAKAENVDEGYCLAIFIDNKEVARGDNSSVSYYLGELKNNVDYSIWVVDESGALQYDADGNILAKQGGTISCNKGFFKRLVAFFRRLTGHLPKETVKPSA